MVCPLCVGTAGPYRVIGISGTPDKWIRKISRIDGICVSPQKRCLPAPYQKNLRQRPCESHGWNPHFNHGETPRQKTETFKACSLRIILSVVCWAMNTKTKEYREELRSQVGGRIRDVQDRVRDRVNDVAYSADQYVRANPWKTIAIVAVAACITGWFMYGTRE